MQQSSPITQSQITDYTYGTKHSINFFPMTSDARKQTGGKLGFRR